MPLFDSLQDAMFGTVTNTMGYDATWTPRSGDQFNGDEFDGVDFLVGEQQTAKVLYNGPTEKEKIFSAEFNPDMIRMEYPKGSFGGMFEVSRIKNSNEVVTIDGIGDFIVKNVRKKWDGKTYEAQLQVKL